MRHPETPLSRERIIDTALDLVNAQGLNRLTMRRLGDMLEVEAMAIYHHLPGGKDELLDGLAGRLMAVTAELGAEPDWRHTLGVWARACRAHLLDHAGLLPLVFTRSAATPGTPQTLDAVYGALHGSGLPRQRVFDSMRTVSSYVLGYAMIEAQAHRSGAVREQVTPPIDATQFPYAAELAAHHEGRGWDEQFEVGLRGILTSID